MRIVIAIVIGIKAATLGQPFCSAWSESNSCGEYPIVGEDDKSNGAADRGETKELVCIGAGTEQVLPLGFRQRAPRVGGIGADNIRTPVVECRIVVDVGTCISGIVARAPAKEVNRVGKNGIAIGVGGDVGIAETVGLLLGKRPCLCGAGVLQVAFGEIYLFSVRDRELARNSISGHLGVEGEGKE